MCGLGKSKTVIISWNIRHTIKDISFSTWNTVKFWNPWSQDGWKYKGIPHHWRNWVKTELSAVIKHNVSEAALGPRRYNIAAGQECQGQDPSYTCIYLYRHYWIWKPVKCFHTNQADFKNALVSGISTYKSSSGSKKNHQKYKINGCKSLHTCC